MSALWHTAKRGGQGADGRRNTVWPECLEKGCTGRILRDSVYADGPELCYAHADGRQRTAALLVMKMHKYVDVRGTILDELHVEQILGGVAAEKFYFRGCTFTGNAPFPGTTLKIETALERDGLSPQVSMDCGQVTFEGGADFRNITFPGRVFFDDTEFAGPLFLDGAQFRDEAWFLRTALTEAHFGETAFERLAGFHNVRATASISFTGAVFTGRTDFDLVHAPIIDLTDTVFSKRAVMFLGRPFPPDELADSVSAEFAGAQFDDGLDLRLSKVASATMRGARFGAPSTITTSGYVPSSNISASNLRFAGGNPDRPLAHVLSLQETDLEKLSLVNVDLAACAFAGALNLDKVRLGGQIRFSALPHGGFRTYWNWPVVWRWSRREVIREEFYWRARVSQESRHRTDATRYFWSNVGTYDRLSVTGDDLASLYRSLRKAREDAKDEPGAGDFYYGEMEARRHSSLVWSGDRWLLTLYWALSGYGQRASRALAALLALLATLTILLTGCGLADSAPVQRITDTARTAAPPPPQVITIDITGQRVTATLPPPAIPPVALDVTAVAPTLPPPDQRWTAARIHRAIRTLVTSLVPISTDQRLTTFGGYVVLAGRVLGAILLGLAVLAIRARVKR